MNLRVPNPQFNSENETKKIADVKSTSRGMDRHFWPPNSYCGKAPHFSAVWAQTQGRGQNGQLMPKFERGMVPTQLGANPKHFLSTNQVTGQSHLAPKRQRVVPPPNFKKLSAPVFGRHSLSNGHVIY